MTKGIYDDRATFKDGSDLDGSYPMEAWIRRCKLMFDADQSHCNILEETLTVTRQQVGFRFSEILTFKTILQPKVDLTGTVVMIRDENTGLIVSYEEKWDQTIQEIIQGTKFNFRSYLSLESQR